MPIRARLQVEGLPEAVKRVDAIGERARRPEPVLRSEATLEDLKASEARRFGTQKGLKKVTPRWAAEKRQRGLDPRTLHATNRLANALSTANRGAGVRFDVFNSELRWGIRGGRSDIYYAQFLSKRWRFVVIDKPARASIAGRVQRFLTGSHAAA